MDAHRSVTGVLDVGHGAGVEVGGRAEVAVGFFAFTHEQVDGGAALGVVDVALSGGRARPSGALRLPLEEDGCDSAIGLHSGG